MVSFEDDKKRRDLWRQSYTDTEIATICGVSRTTIYSWRQKNNLKSNSKGKGNFLEESEELLRYDLFEKGHTDEEIADIIGISKMSVFQWRSRNGLSKTRQTNSIKYQDLTDKEKVFYDYLKYKHSDLRESTLLALSKFVEPRDDLSPGANLRRYAKKIKASGLKTVFYYDDGDFSCINEAVKFFVHINKDTIYSSNIHKLTASIPKEYISLIWDEVNKLNIDSKK